MKERAIENIRAAQALVVGNLPNAAASRAYYSVYQAGWFLLEEAGEEPPDDQGRRYWRHDTFAVELLRRSVLTSRDDVELVQHLASHRVRADYYEDGVTPGEATELTRDARDLLERIGVLDPMGS